LAATILEQLGPCAHDPSLYTGVYTLSTARIGKRWERISQHSRHREILDGFYKDTVARL